MDNKDIVKFYDEYASHQESVAFNERHLFLLRMLRKQGLGSSSRVLELGCGIGVMTSLMATRVKTGRIVAVDISPMSVAVAERRLRGTAPGQVDFAIADVADFRADNRPFDFVTLCDVLEHIPLARHGDVFRTISAHTGDRTKVVINIPNSAYQEHLRQHEAHSLQIVDETVTADHICRCAYANGLALHFFMTYGVWHEDDYQVMTFRRQQPYEMRAIRRGRAEIAMERGRRLWRRVMGRK